MAGHRGVWGLRAIQACFEEYLEYFEKGEALQAVGLRE
jgi:hypothetical protein